MANDSRFHRLNLHVEKNCIKNDDPPIPFYPVVYGINPTDLLESHETFINNHPDMDPVLVAIANTMDCGIFNPTAQVVLYTFYLNFLETFGIQILPLIDQLKKHSEDLIYLSSFESILLVAHFLASEKHLFMFLDSEDANAPTLMMLDEGLNKGIAIDIWCHWVESHLRSWVQFSSLLRSISPPTKTRGQNMEMDIIRRLQDGSIEGDIIMLDEGMRMVEIIGDLYPHAQFHNAFSFQKGNIIFFGLQDEGKLLFFETALSTFLKKLQDTGIG